MQSALTSPISGVRSPFGQGVWTPRRLFTASEPGVWFDPSDLSTMFQDAAGTTPVTGVEQPVGLHLDKSKGLALGPELVTTPDLSSATGWSVGGTTSIYIRKTSAFPPVPRASRAT